MEGGEWEDKPLATCIEQVLERNQISARKSAATSLNKCWNVSTFKVLQWSSATLALISAVIIRALLSAD